MNPLSGWEVDEASLKDSSEKEFEDALDRLSREPEIESQLRLLGSKCVVRIPFEYLVKHRLDQVFVDQPKRIARLKKKLSERLAIIDLSKEGSEVFVDIVPIPDQVKHVSELSVNDEGKLVFLRGRVTDVTPPKPKTIGGIWVCTNCGAKLHERPKDGKCPRCQERNLKQKTIYEDYQKFRLEHVIVEVQQPWIPLEVRPGQHVRVTGILRLNRGQFYIECIGLEPLQPETIKPEEPAKRLSHLNDLEDPNVAGEIVIVRAVVASGSVSYLAPRKVFVDIYNTAFEIPKTDPRLLKFIACSDGVKLQRLKQEFGLPSLASVRFSDHWTIYLVRVRPIVYSLTRVDEKIVDEAGREYKVFDIFIVSDKPLTLRCGASIELVGIVVPHPKNQRITLLAHEAKLLEDELRYDREKY